MKVYELHKAFYSKLDNKWHPTGNRSGTLYSSLEKAKSIVQNHGEWIKDERRRVWRNSFVDIIQERKIL